MVMYIVRALGSSVALDEGPEYAVPHVKPNAEFKKKRIVIFSSINLNVYRYKAFGGESFV